MSSPEKVGSGGGDPEPQPAADPGEIQLDQSEVTAAARVAARRALEEDLREDGDVTSDATISADRFGRAAIVARAEGVVAGTALVAIVYDLVDPRITVDMALSDGARVVGGLRLGTVAGPLRGVLTGERTVLNFLTHLSGIATRTRAFVDAVSGTGCTIRDTRKTTPGLRVLEKAAVRAGGGANHRAGLWDALLVKDNHVAAAGSLEGAVRRAFARAGGRHVQVEVRSRAEAQAAIEAGARDLLLDNLDVEATKTVVERVRDLESVFGRIVLESSGGITLATARAYAETGVDRLAVGELTHSAPQLDVALDLVVDAADHDWRD